MRKISQDFILHMDDEVKCDCCGKEMRLGERVCNIPGNVCVPCADKGYYASGGSKKTRKPLEKGR